MAKGLNKVILIGHLGQDPEIKYTQSGDAVANVSLATTDQWKSSDGEKQSRTEWHKIVAWRKLAEIMGQYCKKGQLICIEGKIQTDKWQNKEGVDMYTTKIIANQMIMLERAPGGERNDGQSQDRPESQAGDFSGNQSGDFSGAQTPDDDIPF